MEHYDPELARRVWLRVRGQNEQATVEVLKRITAEERQSAVILQRLSRQFRGKSAAMLRKLALQEEEHARILSSLL